MLTGLQVSLLLYAPNADNAVNIKPEERHAMLQSCRDLRPTIYNRCNGCYRNKISGVEGDKQLRGHGFGGAEKEKLSLNNLQ
jgi:hypothetical protein